MKKPLKHNRLTHIIDEYLKDNQIMTVCGKREHIFFAIQAGEEPTCNNCKIYHQDTTEEFVIHNEETETPTQEELDRRLDEYQNELAQKETKRCKGRPKKDTTRDQVKPTRWTAEQWAEVTAAADLAGMTPSAFIRSAVLSQARAIPKPMKPLWDNEEDLLKDLDSELGSALAAARNKRKPQ